MEGCRWEDQNLQLKGGSAPDEEEPRVQTESDTTWRMLLEATLYYLTSAFMIFKLLCPNYNSSCCFIWVWNLIANKAGGT